MEDVIRFNDKLRAILKKRKIDMIQFCIDTGIDKASFFYKNNNRHRRAYYMAIAYYLGMTVEDLIEGTDAIDVWYS